MKETLFYVRSEEELIQEQLSTLRKEIVVLRKELAALREELADHISDNHADKKPYWFDQE